MAIDPYDPCPCGSGKKVKFCCQNILPELDRVGQLRNEGQNRLALQLLEKLEAANPHNSWVLLQKGIALLVEGRSEDARGTVARALQEEPIHPFAYTLQALIALQQDSADVDAVVEQALEHHSPVFMSELTLVATEMATRQYAKRHWMSALRYFLIAVRFALASSTTSKPELAQRAIAILQEFQRDKHVPYPFRNGYGIRRPRAEIAELPEFARARDAAQQGAVRVAIRLFQELIKSHPRESALWYNAGICAAWIGDDEQAAKALRCAAGTEADFEEAVEAETLAQLLEQSFERNRARATVVQFKVHSVARLLTRIDQQPCYVRGQITTAEFQAEPTLTTVYRILDRSAPTSEAPAKEALPNLIGILKVYAEDPEHKAPARAQIDVASASEAARLSSEFQTFASGEVEDPQELPVVLDHAAEYGPLEVNLVPRSDSPMIERRRLVKSAWERSAYEIWPNLPLAALGGKTPLQAAENNALRIPLAASINVLDVFCDARNFALMSEELRSRLKLPERKPYAVTEQTDLSRLTFLQLRRLPFYELTDAQFTEIFPTCSTSQHILLTYDALTEFVSRSLKLPAGDDDSVYGGLVDFSITRGNREEALAWISKGREHARGSKQAFERMLNWDIRELGIRLEDPKDPQLIPLATQIWNYYGAKIPEIRQELTSVFTQMKITPPWTAGNFSGALAGVGGGGGTIEQSGLWTPSAPAATEGGSGQLWLPGQ